jgi:hypothetical protein
MVYKVPLRKGSTFRILTDKPRIESLLRQRDKSHSFTGSPVNFIILNRFPPGVNEHLLQSRMHVEPTRNSDGLKANLLQHVCGITCVTCFGAPLREFHVCPLVSQAATPTVDWIPGLRDVWSQLETCLVLGLKVSIDLASQGLQVLV